MGLNDQFTGVRGQILLMKPLPSLSQCYSLLLQEENQRSLACGSHVITESVAMVVKNVGTCYQAGKINKRSSQDNKDQLLCDFCHMTGHAKDKCYCIHGFPSWHKLYGIPSQNLDCYRRLSLQIKCLAKILIQQRYLCVIILLLLVLMNLLLSQMIIANS